MAVTSDIMRSYHQPGDVFRGLLARGVTDRLGLVFLALAMALSFVSQLPFVTRMSLRPDPELEARIQAEAGEVRQIEGTQVPQDMIDAKYQLFLSGQLMIWFFILPLFFYAVAWFGGWITRRAGGQIDGITARVAFFWALVVALPMKLLHGAVYAVTDEIMILAIAGLPWVAILVWNWTSNLRAAGWSG